jgi:CHASE2 domain-containing sensor protein
MRKIKTVLIIFLFFKLVVFLAHSIYVNFKGVQLLHFEHLATEDIEFNDIYYFTGVSDYTNNNKHILLINTGSIANDSTFRTSLAKLINNVGKYKPKKIGLDILFIKSSDNISDSLLNSSINKNKVVLALDANFPNQLLFNSYKKGIVNFPEKKDQTIRSYYNYRIISSDTLYSFSSELSNTFSRDSIDYLKYSSDAKGFYNILDSNQIVPNNFPAIEGSELVNDSINPKIAELIKGKIIIIGHLGSESMDNRFDTEDKFRVPVSKSLFNRNLTMPGSVIHANAVEMNINKDKMVSIQGWKYELIINLILLGFLYLFYSIHHKFKLGKLFNILIILMATLPIIFIFCVYLMDLNIYIKVGSLFMQIAFIEEFIDVANGFKDKYFTKNKL